MRKMNIGINFSLYLFGVGLFVHNLFLYTFLFLTRDSDPVEAALQPEV